MSRGRLLDLRSLNKAVFNQDNTRHKAERPGTGCLHRRSGSKADSMSRGRSPGTGRPPNEAVCNQDQAPKPHRPAI